MQSPPKFISILLMLAIMSGLVSACGGTAALPVTTLPATPTTTLPINTPPATTLPTTMPPATAPPVTAPATTTVAAPKYTYETEIFSNKVSIATDAKGAILEPFEAKSPDGVVTIKLEKGTKLTDRDFAPVKTFSVSVNTESPVQPNDGSKIIGTTVTLLSNTSSTSIFPPLIYEFNYSGFDAQIAAVTDAQLTLGFLLPRGDWATFVDSKVDTANKMVTGKVEVFAGNYAIALLAQPPKIIVKATEGPKNGIDVSVLSGLDAFGPTFAVTLRAKTTPGARIMLWVVNPSTGTRSTYPANRTQIADAEGKATWDFTVHRDTAKGEGHIEFYITTSTDPVFLSAFTDSERADSKALETIFPDMKDEITKFKQGLIELIELDEHTTLRMFPVTFK